MVVQEAVALQTKHRVLFRLLGIPWTVSATSWQFPLSRLMVGMVIAFLFSPASNILERIAFGVLYGLLLMAFPVMHIIGHTIGGLRVNAPMDENLIERDFICTTYYFVPPDLPRRVHLTRTLAGPLMNITLGIVFGVLTQTIGGHVLRYIAAMNLLLSFITLMPIPSLDGEIIWRELRRS